MKFLLTDRAKNLAFFACISIVCLYILWCALISHDGAFNSQAAINLYKTGLPTLNNRPNAHLQTFLPFQILNGAYLVLLGRSLLTANLANITFYLLLAFTVFKVSSAYQSKLLLLAFAVISFSPSFQYFGFLGFGEVPGLTLGIASAAILSFAPLTIRLLLLSGLLLGLSLSTKLILWLILPAYALLLLLRFPGIVKTFLFATAAAIPVVITALVHSATYSADEAASFTKGIVSLSTPRKTPFSGGALDSLPAWLTRLSEVWEQFSISILDSTPYLKAFLVILVLIGFFNALQSNGEEKRTQRAFFLFLSTFALTYLLWSLFFNASLYTRRSLNADILITLAASLTPTFLPRVGKMVLVLSFTYLLLLLDYMPFFGYKISECKQCNLVKLEHELRTAFNTLPPSSRLFGFARLEAPRWSFLTSANHKNILQVPVFSDCVGSTCDTYLFREPGTTPTGRDWEAIEKSFEIERIYEFKEFEIVRVRGLNLEQSIPSSCIDEPDSPAITHIDKNVRALTYGSPAVQPWDIAITLQHSREPSLSLDVEVNACLVDTPLTLIGVLGENELLFQTELSGSLKRSALLSLPDRGHQEVLTLYLSPQITPSTFTECTRKASFPLIQVHRACLLIGPEKENTVTLLHFDKPTRNDTHRSDFMP